MKDELKPVRCGCGGEAVVRPSCFFTGTDLYLVQCKRCGTATLLKDTEAEAIEVWNRAMGTNTRRLLEVLVHDATDTNVGDKFDKDTNVLCKERTAKVENIHQEYDPEGICFFDYGDCDNCGAQVQRGDRYCSECGARLEWE